MSTTHTTDAFRTIHRIVSAFALAEQPMVRIRLADAIRAIVSMRLLPRQDGTGLIPAVELLVATNVIRECIREEKRTAEIVDHMAKGRMFGMQTFDQDLLRLLREGLISREAALAAATAPADLELRLRLGGDEDDEEMTIVRHQFPDVPTSLDLDIPEPPPAPPPGTSPGPPPGLRKG
jgi:twitching motility protein PilT